MSDATSDDIRAATIRELLADPTVRAIAGNVGSLAILPRTYHELCKATADPNTTIEDITRIVETDSAVSVRILQVVNSAFFGMAQRTSSIPKAVEIVGTSMLKSLILSAHMCNALELAPTSSFSLTNHQSYSIRVARLARRLAAPTDLVDDAFTAGIVLGLGQIILALREPLRFEQVLTRTALTGERQFDVERDIIGTTSAEVGAYLLSSWAIPFPIVECVAFQYRPEQIGPGDVRLLGFVHAADALTGILTCGDPEESLDMEFLERAGLADQVPRWRRLAAQD